MATRREADVVYAAGLVQGIVLVTFPAASTIFTDPGEYDLSNTQYGTMFLPQVVTAIVASVLGASLARRFGTKRVYLAGLVANLASMALLIVSQFTTDQAVAYGSFTSRTGLFISYLVGAAIMMLGGVMEVLIGINAEGKSLEDVTKPLTAADQTSTVRPAPITTAAEA